jgi:hypothetical protein
MRSAFNSKWVAVVAVVVLLHTRASAQQDSDSAAATPGNETTIRNYYTGARAMHCKPRAAKIENEKQTEMPLTNFGVAFPC